MKVSADQVAALRAFLEGDFFRHKKLVALLDHSRNTALDALYTAAFLEAIDRRFPKGSKLSEVTELVQGIRVRFEGRFTDTVDPYVAERLIRAMLTDEEIDDLDGSAVTHTKLFLLYLLVADERLDEAALDTVLAEARAEADKWLAKEQAPTSDR